MKFHSRYNYINKFGGLMHFKNLFLFFGLMLLTSCASGFETNYLPTSYLDVPVSSYELCLDTKVERISPFERSVQLFEEMEERGYILIGQAKWESAGEESNQTAYEQGIKVGACLVYWSRVEAGVEHSLRSVGTYVPGHRRTVIVDGDAITVDVPGKTVYHQEPYDYPRYEYRGYFFAKAKQ